MRYEKKTERKDTGTDTDVSPGPQRNFNGGFEGGGDSLFAVGTVPSASEKSSSSLKMSVQKS